MGDMRLGGEPRDDGERLPWLEAAEVEAERTGPSMVKVIALVIVGILLLGAIVGGYSWWSQRGATGGNGDLIAAPAGPYKVKPDKPGGMDVQGEGETAFAASKGAEPQGRIDMGAVPEAPLTKNEEEKAQAPPAGAASAPTTPAQAPADISIQLGAFSSEVSANNAWKALAGRFSYMEPLSHSVLAVKSGDKTLYRLRASGPGAANICGRLRIAGETCLSVD